MAPLSNSTRPDASSEPSADREMQTGPMPVSVAERVIERFGGIRPMAGKLKIPVTTVQGWKKRGAIPPSRFEDLQAAAARLGIRLDDFDLEAAGTPAPSAGQTGDAPSAAGGGDADGMLQSVVVAAAPAPVHAQAPADAVVAERSVETQGPATVIGGPVGPAVAAPAVVESPAVAPQVALAAATPVTAPAAVAPVSAPAAVTPVSAPAAVTPVSARAAVTPVSVPAAVTPVSAPAAVTPVSVPAAVTPVGAPAVATPLSVPEAVAPVSVPAAVTPASASDAGVPAVTAVGVEPVAVTAAVAAPRLAAPGEVPVSAASGAGLASPGAVAEPGGAASPSLPSTPAMPRIETAAEIPPVAIPSFQIPPASVALRESAEAPRPRAGEAQRRPSSLGRTVPARNGGSLAGGNGGLNGTGHGHGEDAGGAGSSSWAALASAAAIVALIAAGVSVVVPMFAGAPPSATTTVLDLEQRIGKLESQLSRSNIQQLQASSSLERRIDTVDRRVTQVAREIGEAGAAVGERVTAVERALPQLEHKIRTMPAGSPTLGTLLAASQLRQALAGYEPYQTALGAVRYAGVNAPDLNEVLTAISARAPTGILTEARLARWFEDFAPSIVSAGSAGLFGRVGDGMAGLLAALAPPVYYGLGFGDSATPRAVVSRAKQALRVGNFGYAVQELSRLEDDAARQAEPWLAEARARLMANHARDLLASYMMSVVSTGRPE